MCRKYCSCLLQPAAGAEQRGDSVVGHLVAGQALVPHLVIMMMMMMMIRPRWWWWQSNYYNLTKCWRTDLSKSDAGKGAIVTSSVVTSDLGVLQPTRCYYRGGWNLDHPWSIFSDQMMQIRVMDGGDVVCNHVCQWLHSIWASPDLPQDMWASALDVC